MLKETLKQLQNDSVTVSDEEYPAENSDLLREYFDASDEENSEVIKPISSTSSGFTGTELLQTTMWFVTR